MAGPRNRNTEEDQYEGYGMGDYLGAVGSGAATGVSSGSFFGPTGAAIGGALGAGVSIADMLMKERQLEEAFAQQQALNQDLEEAGADIESFMQDSAINAGRMADQAETEAEFSARRAGVSPFQAEMLKQAVRNDAAASNLASQGQRLQAAQAATDAARRQVLTEYGTAQELQNNALSDTGLSDAFAAAAQGAALYGQLQGRGAGKKEATLGGIEDLADVNTDFARSTEERGRERVMGESGDDVTITPPKDAKGEPYQPQKYSPSSGGFAPGRAQGTGLSAAQLMAGINMPGAPQRQPIVLRPEGPAFQGPPLVGPDQFPGPAPGAAPEAATEAPQPVVGPAPAAPSGAPPGQATAPGMAQNRPDISMRRLLEGAIRIPSAGSTPDAQAMPAVPRVQIPGITSRVSPGLEQAVSQATTEVQPAAPAAPEPQVPTTDPFNMGLPVPAPFMDILNRSQQGDQSAINELLDIATGE